MPVLAISQEMLATVPDVAGVIVAATMLWPDDAAARERAVEAG